MNKVLIAAALSATLMAPQAFAQTDYNAKDVQGASLKPSATIGTVGIGYLF